MGDCCSLESSRYASDVHATTTSDADGDESSDGEAPPESEHLPVASRALTAPFPDRFSMYDPSNQQVNEIHPQMKRMKTYPPSQPSHTQATQPVQVCCSISCFFFFFLFSFLILFSFGSVFLSVITLMHLLFLPV